jgi:hypothetical protein
LTVRVVFDTNILDVENFEALEKSLLLALFKKHRVTPVYGHVFIEETLRAYGAAAKRDFLVNRWLPFVVATCDAICNDFNGIFHEDACPRQRPTCSAPYGAAGLRTFQD